MTHTIKRRLGGGVAAVAMASGLALMGAGTSSAAPDGPSAPGSSVGQKAFVQGGNDPNIHKFTWTGNVWRYDGCWGSPYLVNVR